MPPKGKTAKKAAPLKKRPMGTWDIFDGLVFTSIIAHVLINPYTKVEETLLTNGIYDHIYLGADIPNYDHQEFPGVVTRSFISSMIISAISLPFNLVLTKGLGFTCLSTLYLTRTVLGILTFCSMKFVRTHLERFTMSRTASQCFFILFLTQFHYLFYASRPLPNIFALIVCNFGIGFWLNNQWEKTIALLAFATIVFRCDIAVLAVAMVGFGILKMNFEILKKCFVWGAITSVICIAATILIDSQIWGRWIWPEL
jgi:alpha-1,6-mannosyltransferase